MRSLLVFNCNESILPRKRNSKRLPAGITKVKTATRSTSNSKLVLLTMSMVGKKIPSTSTR